MSFMHVIEVFDYIMLQSVLSSGCSSLKNLFVTARRRPLSSLYTVAMAHVFSMTYFICKEICSYRFKYMLESLLCS